MKNKKLRSLLAVLLVFSMFFTMAVPASAASGRTTTQTVAASSWWNSLWNSFIERLTGKDQGTDDSTTGETLELIEDSSTVQEGTELRASTYGLPSTIATTDNIKYFPVTMYNYTAGSGNEAGKEAGFNNAMHQYEVDHATGTLTQWNGMYFSSGNPSDAAYSYTTPNTVTAVSSVPTYLEVQNGTYYMDAAFTNEVRVSIAETPGETTYSAVSNLTYYQLASTAVSDWKDTGLYYKDGTEYYPIYVILETNTTSSWYGSTTTYTYTISYGEQHTILVDNQQVSRPNWTSPNFTAYQKKTTTTYTYTLVDSNGDVLATNTSNTASTGVTLYQKSTPPGTTENIDSIPYANHNKWTGNFEVTGILKHGNHVYSGLVQPTLDVNKNIIFTVPDVGLFTSAPVDGKAIYTNVGLPFQYDTTTKKYTFDANTMGAYFADGIGSDKNLTYTSSPQTNTNNDVQDGRKNGWYPFNSTATVTTSTADYYFGMAATIPFTMTADGKLSSAENAEDIIFNFSGDDDVWVFIDGQLVLDLGGIHNGVNGELNFAANTFEITRMVTTVGDVTQDASGNNAPMSGKIFTDETGAGKIAQTRESFAATDTHELTVFYLERGAGSSNCKIEFNLPMKDSVTVKKQVSTVDSANQALSAEVLAQINNRDFGFTLYKDGNPVANYNYSLLNANGQYVQTASTDAAGHFTLKNNQTAKFIGEIAATGSGYYVVEDSLGTGWQAPTWTYTAQAANGATQTASTVSGQSMTVTAKGSEEAEDSVNFVCANVMTHVDGTSLEANIDTIVIDYGLPVEIDVLANDVVVGGTKVLSEVNTEQVKFGTATIENGKIKYTLTKQLTDVEILTYTVNAIAANGVATDNKTATAQVRIVPATTMYYEENFSDMVTYTGAWTNKGTVETDPQEPGVVGTIGDSPYGSDVAYLKDSGDSNGSSKYIDTTSGAAQFSYTFTGTGTSFFARTTNESAYMRVVVKNTETNETTTFYRNTKYINSNNETLYNIPVFSTGDLGYGTYTVTVTIAKKTGTTYGGEFWLDGIRVVKPMDTTSANNSIAEGAYNTDGEMNCVINTLREKILTEDAVEGENGLEWAGTGYVLFTDIDGAMVKASDYQSIGPKEEVYLNAGQSISFSLTDWNPNEFKLYLGMKAPKGSGTVLINGTAIALSNTVDCYYDISQYISVTTAADGTMYGTVKIEAGASSLISITTLKATGASEFALIPPVDTIVDGAEGGDVVVNSADGELY